MSQSVTSGVTFEPWLQGIPVSNCNYIKSLNNCSSYVSRMVKQILDDESGLC